MQEQIEEKRRMYAECKKTHLAEQYCRIHGTIDGFDLDAALKADEMDNFIQEMLLDMIEIILDGCKDVQSDDDSDVSTESTNDTESDND